MALLVSPLPGEGITGALSVIDLFAQLLNPRNNPKGKIRGIGTHFAWLLTFDGHPPFILERLSDGVQFKKVDEGDLLGAKVVKIDPLHRIQVRFEDVWNWLSNQEEQSYNLVVNNCKHFAYDPWNVWVRFIHHVFW